MRKEIRVNLSIDGQDSTVTDLNGNVIHKGRTSHARDLGKNLWKGNPGTDLVIVDRDLLSDYLFIRVQLGITGTTAGAVNNLQRILEN